ncbi:hypothetical protein BACCOPRO_03703 [Phocaeicola coprophilus DSM 18228 = JCM 13818]|uniref:Uncharacterized protein n=1 Tax=Phocaeicola coprophilus DSM 18228 = JCM 13818 TaxID=547042 RepID=S0FCI2_9BACT|nr:hypothetical protein BACCOPRO_03703 [Phocaeicola coprophilus DSM 18228 = JCM 13818]
MMHDKARQGCGDTRSGGEKRPEQSPEKLAYITENEYLYPIIN